MLPRAETGLKDGGGGREEDDGQRILRHSVLTSGFLGGTGRQEENIKMALNNGEMIKRRD